MNFKERIPSIEQLLQVFSMVTVVLYSWSLLRFFWRLPSFILSSTIDEIAFYYSYLVVVNFLESISLLIIPVLLSLILPVRWFYENFVVKSTLLLGMGLWYISLIANRISPAIPFPYDMVRIAPLVLMVIILLSFTLSRNLVFQKIILSLTERLTVFLYIIVPITVISILVVIARNIF